MKRTFKAICLIVFVAALISLMIGCSVKDKNFQQSLKEGSEKKVLRVGLVPNQAPDELKAKYDIFKKYLEAKLGMKIELFVANNYAGVVEAMVSDKLDMAYFGGVTYVQAKQRAKVHPIVTEVDSETKTTKYYSLIITQADSKLKSLSELRGKNFAFGDVSSTSGSLYPRIMLDQAGLKVPEDFTNVIYTGKHDATALAVQNGKVDAGGLEGRILNKLAAEGKVDMSKLKILAKSDFIEGYPWVVQDSMSQELEDKIVNAFLTMDNPELLKLMKAERFAQVSADDYKFVEEQAKRFGLLK